MNSNEPLSLLVRLREKLNGRRLAGWLTDPPFNRPAQPLSDQSDWSIALFDPHDNRGAECEEEALASETEVRVSA